MDEKINAYLSGKKEDVEPKTVDGQVTSNLHPQVGDICQKARFNASTERQTLERCIEQSKGFKEDDFRYLSVNGHFKSVKRWAEEQLKNIQRKKSDPVEVHVANP